MKLAQESGAEGGWEGFPEDCGAGACRQPDVRLGCVPARASSRHRMGSCSQPGGHPCHSSVQSGWGGGSCPFPVPKPRPSPHSSPSPEGPGLRDHGGAWRRAAAAFEPPLSRGKQTGAEEPQGVQGGPTAAAPHQDPTICEARSLGGWDAMGDGGEGRMVAGRGKGSDGPTQPACTAARK